MNPLKHVAIIMDGNGRWGLKHKNSRNAGHKAGLKSVEKVIKESIKNNIKYLTLFAFSTENWKRPKKEINYLFKLINFYFKKELDNIIKNKIKINIIGNINSLPSNIKENLKEVIDKTANNKKLIINLAINYGSKTEIVEAFKKIKKKKEAISIKNIEKNLYTTVPNPDILIRTGGKKRLSNFLLWQLAYSEFYFLDKLWPDFSKKDLINIIANFKKIKRNFGNI